MDNWNLVEYNLMQMGQQNPEYKILKTIEKVPELGMLMKINGEIYAPCYINRQQKCFMAHKINPSQSKINRNTHNLECPYCGHEYRNSWELGNEGEIECGQCGALLEWECEIQRTFITELIKKPEFV